MIYISQGHEKGIGLEVFFKSFVLLNTSSQRQLHLFCTRQSIEENLKNLGFSYSIESEGLLIGPSKLKVTFVEEEGTPSQMSFDAILERIKKSDILFTLPTSKDQLSMGHTEYLRKLFQKPSLPMTFVGPSETLLLLTDHIPLNRVTSDLKTPMVCEKVTTTLKAYQKWKPFEEVIFAGINPHAGEGGLLGKGEEVLEEAIEKLQKEFPKVKFIGPLPSDALHYSQKKSVHQLIIYAYHDQGLTKFKAQNQTLGVNQTLGLPFLRLSVDHGTAFNLYGKNKANALGCLYALKYAINRHQQL